MENNKKIKNTIKGYFNKTDVNNTCQLHIIYIVLLKIQTNENSNIFNYIVYII